MSDDTTGSEFDHGCLHVGAEEGDEGSGADNEDVPTEPVRNSEITAPEGCRIRKPTFPSPRVNTRPPATLNQFVVE